MLIGITAIERGDLKLLELIICDHFPYTKCGYTKTTSNTFATFDHFYTLNYSTLWLMLMKSVIPTYVHIHTHIHTYI